MSRYDEVATIVRRWSGIAIDRGGQRKALEQAVARRIALLGLPSEEAYVGLLGRNRAELAAIVNAVTIGHTSFFRDAAQIRAIVSVLDTAGDEKRPKHVWIPGCATGEDAYTVAIAAASAGVHVRIVASDVNSNAIAFANAGLYDRGALDGIPERYRAFCEWEGARFRFSASVRQKISFKHHNLLEPPLWAPGGWDVILCRNVLIYFDKDAAHDAISRMVSALSLTGHLFLGAAEVPDDIPGVECVAIGERHALRVSTRATLDRAPPQARTLAPTETAGEPPSSAIAATPVAPIVAKEPPSYVVASESVGRGPGEDLECALAMLARGEIREAVDALYALVHSHPAWAEAYLALGIALHMHGSSRRAAEILRNALLLDDTLWHACFYLALCYERLGLKEDALRQYRRVVRLGEETSASPPSSILARITGWQHEMLVLAARRATGHSE